MTITKREYSAVDGAIAVLYVKKNGDDTVAYPLIASPRSQTPKGDAIQVQIGPGDVISNIPVFIDYEHHQIHEGETFRWSVYTSSLAQNASKDIRFVVPDISIPDGVNPAEKCPHFRFEVVTSDAAQVFFYETPTITVAGTSRSTISLERNGTYSSKLQVWEDPTATTTGTLIWQGLLTVAKNNAGGLSSAVNEFVLKNNSEYLFRVTSAASSNKVLERFEWYEDLGV